MISILVCTYNREPYLAECLGRILTAMESHPEVEAELIVVDNNSTDRTAEIIGEQRAAHAGVRMLAVTETQQGLSHARNRAVREAQGDWLVFLDDDAMVQADYTAQLQAAIADHPDMVAFGGRIFPRFESGHAPSWLCRWNRSWLSALDMGERVTTMLEPVYPIGANMGYRRTMAEACGAYNTELGRKGRNMIGGEEKDYFARIRSLHAGQIYYLPTLAVEHVIPVGRTTYDYIARLGQGVGRSERMRTRGAAYAGRLLAEGVKWAATLMLLAYYVLTLRAAKGYSLTLFRFHVSRGLLCE